MAIPADKLPSKLTTRRKTDDRANALPPDSGVSEPNESSQRKSGRRAGGHSKASTDLPHSIEAEKGIIGSVLVSRGEAMAEARRHTNEHYYYHPSHRTIFTALCDMWDSGVKLDLITFTQFLRDRGKLDEVGGAAYVTDLFSFVPAAANIQYYIDIIREKYVQRQIIMVGSQMMRAAHGDQASGNMAELLESFTYKLDRIKHDAGGPNGSEQFSFADLMAFDSKHDPDCLVGNRYIVKGGSSLWCGGSGYGKSSLQLQLAVYWSCGEDCFGLRPVRPLKSLIIQAENDKGDMGEQLQGVIAGISAAGDLDVQRKRELIEKNVGIHRVVSKSGPAFLGLLETLLDIDRPDMVWIDPLFAFSGCDLLNPEKTGRFLREGLFAMCDKHKTACNVIHHIGKPVKDPKGNAPKLSELDYQYLGFGSSEIQNAFRAINVLIPCGSGVFKLVLSKRGERAGAKDIEGKWARSVFLTHSKEGICWLQVEEPEDDEGGRPAKFDASLVLDEMSIVHGCTTDTLAKRVYREHNMSRATFFRLFGELKKMGKVTRDAEGWKRKPKKELK